MIISASRRTDIPSYFSEWFFHRLEEGYVLVRNPMNAHQISKVSLRPEVVDGIVFWTKNPAQMLKRLDGLEKYNYYFQFTLTAYGPEVEKGIPSKNKAVIPVFQQLSKTIGKERVVWRYDPIFFSEVYTLEYHCRYFEVLASKLAQYTEKCTVSFLDIYRNMARNVKPLGIRPLAAEEQVELMGRFVGIAEKYNIYIDTCTEAYDFSKLGVMPAHCIDKSRFERIGGYRLNIGKDKNQRDGCGCIESIDIGAYNTCRNGCLYCYANHSDRSIDNNFRRHNTKSPLLTGEINEKDMIKEKNAKSNVDGQMFLFGS